MSGTYLYQINQVVNIDNQEKNVTFGKDPVKVYKNLTDTAVTPLVRVLGGTWTDDVYTHNILAHPDTEDNSYTDIVNKTLNIASDGDAVTMKGKTLAIASVEDGSVTTINGKQLTVGEDTSTLIVKGTTLSVGSSGQSGTTTVNGKTVSIAENNVAGSATTIFGKALTMAEDGSVVVMKGQDTTISSVATGTTTTINGKTLQIGEATSVTTFDSDQLTLATATRDGSTTVNGKALTLGENGRTGTTANLYSEQISIGDDANTTNVDVYGNQVVIDADTSLRTTTDLFQLNESSDGAYLRMQKNVTNGNAEINLGDLTNTETINIKGQNIHINGEKNLELSTEVFEFNKDSRKAYFEVNDVDSRITIGREKLDTTTIHGSNVYIGEPGCTTTIYGKLVAYQEGSNIITNTVTQETAAFHVHNTGTSSALTVIQDNSTSGGGQNLAEFYTAGNQDRTPLRIDSVGRIGMGVLAVDDLKAWLHINRNDQTGTLTYEDLLMVEDQDSDQTPFIIKKAGDVGIGTDVPRYKLDVWTAGSTLNGQGDTIRSKGIALRDVVYVKQNHTNRILFALGNKVYDHTAGVPADTFKTGYTFSYDKSDVAYANSDNTVNPALDPADGTFTFRMTCKMHIAGSDGSTAYRRFEIFVNPQSGSPAHVVVTDIFDSTHDFYHFPNDPVVVNDGTDWKLEIPWKLNEVHPNKTSFVYPTTSRVYLDVEFFGHESIGDIKAVPLHYNGTTSL